MDPRLLFEIQREAHLLQELQGLYDVRRVGPEATVIFPIGWTDPSDIYITFGAITHGNELVGIAVLNELLESLARGEISLLGPLGLIWGNLKAAHLGQRFCDSDLNRVFSKIPNSAEGHEYRRAQIMAPILAASRFFIDLHQTIRPSESAFFIFPFSYATYAFALTLAPLPTVTHFKEEGALSHDGMGTDGFVQSQKGIGLTLELGQKGWSDEQTNTGVQIVKKALHLAQTPTILSRHLDNIPSSSEGPCYTVAASLLRGAHASWTLRPGLHNFQSILKGELLGYWGTSKEIGSEFFAPRDGLLLFPKYQEGPLVSAPPGEICLFLEKVDPGKLAKKKEVL